MSNDHDFSDFEGVNESDNESDDEDENQQELYEITQYQPLPPFCQGDKFQSQILKKGGIREKMSA